MKTKVFIVLRKTGPSRMTKHKPDLRRDEIAVGVVFEVPDSAFLAPIVDATIIIPDNAIIVPEISVEVVEPA